MAQNYNDIISSINSFIQSDKNNIFFQQTLPDAKEWNSYDSTKTIKTYNSGYVSDSESSYTLSTDATFDDILFYLSLPWERSLLINNNPIDVALQNKKFTDELETLLNKLNTNFTAGDFPVVYQSDTTVSDDNWWVKQQPPTGYNVASLFNATIVNYCTNNFWKSGIPSSMQLVPHTPTFPALTNDYYPNLSSNFDYIKQNITDNNKVNIPTILFKQRQIINTQSQCSDLTKPYTHVLLDPTGHKKIETIVTYTQPQKQLTMDPTCSQTFSKTCCDISSYDGCRKSKAVSPPPGWTCPDYCYKMKCPDGTQQTTPCEHSQTANYALNMTKVLSEMVVRLYDTGEVSVNPTDGDNDFTKIYDPKYFTSEVINKEIKLLTRIIEPTAVSTPTFQLIPKNDNIGMSKNGLFILLKPGSTVNPSQNVSLRLNIINTTLLTKASMIGSKQPTDGYLQLYDNYCCNMTTGSQPTQSCKDIKLSSYVDPKCKCTNSNKSKLVTEILGPGVKADAGLLKYANCIYKDCDYATPHDSNILFSDLAAQGVCPDEVTLCDQNVTASGKIINSKVIISSNCGTSGNYCDPENKCKSTTGEALSQDKCVYTDGTGCYFRCSAEGGCVRTTQLVDGGFKSEDKCDCSKPSSQYKCDTATRECIDSTGAKVDQSKCGAGCWFVCDNGSCLPSRKTTDISYTNTECGCSKPDTWDCVEGVCKKQTDGKGEFKSETECKCKPKTNNNLILLALILCVFIVGMYIIYVYK